MQTVCLLRDARKGRLHVRFVAVDSKFKVRRGFLGMAVDFGAGSNAILQATDGTIARLATKYLGTLRAVAMPSLRKRLVESIHMITVDAASDEIVASELGRMRRMGHPPMPNMRVVLRDKAHGCCRTARLASLARSAPLLHGLVLRAAPYVCLDRNRSV